MFSRRTVLGVLPFLYLSRPGAGLAAKPEDVFKGRIILTKDRLPTHFPSAGAFIAALLFPRLGLGLTLGGGLVGAIVTSALGAIVLLLIVNLLRGLF